LQIVLKEIPIHAAKLKSMQNWEEHKISTFNIPLIRTRKRQCNFLASRNYKNIFALKSYTDKLQTITEE